MPIRQVAMTLAAALMAAPIAPAPEAPAPRIDHAIVISVDGLRPECVGQPLGSLHPALARLARGPHTLEARCDPDISITLPNHVGMVTGRLVAGANGHGWARNEDPPARVHGGTLHAKGGAYIAGMFDVAHDRGLRTALISGKWKFTLFEQSYGEDAGGPDTVAPDNGRDKIDAFACSPEAGVIAELGIAALRLAADRGQRSLTMLHFPNTDFAGHAKGWDLSEGSDYRKAALEIDQALQRLLAAIEADDRLRGRVGIVLTADHGGGVPRISHTDVEAPVNFTIPFLVWLGADRTAGDLYALNAGRRARPAPGERFTASAPPPIRNAEAGNTALELLGLPPIPGSSANGTQDLRLVDAPAGR